MSDWINREKGRLKCTAGQSCMICKKPAVWVEICSESPFCSEECEDALWKEIAAIEATLPDIDL